MSRMILFCLFVFGPFEGYSSDSLRYTIKYIQEEIKLDGALNEDAWTTTSDMGMFWQFFPEDTTYANDQTEIRMVYDDRYLYVSVKSYHPGKSYVVPSLKRDFRAGGNDNITLLFDTFSDGQNCFFFGINPLGVQREGLISGGGTGLGGFSTSWDNKWFSETKIYDNYWIAELKIPFSILRYDEGETTWRFNSYRFDNRENEQSTLVHIPRAQWIFHLGYFDIVEFEKPLPKGTNSIVAIPYIIGGHSRDLEEDASSHKFNIGADAKIPITSGLNLDITANPDFSQVEVDRQVTNLDRFEIFFPERRQFFIENEDLFGGFGFSDMNPFFSRRIGIATDTTTGTTIQNTIFGGGRLSGKVNNNLRIGILNMQTAKDEKNGQPSFNFGVAALQRKVGDKSNIGLVFVNKQAFGDTDQSILDQYNRVLGLDYNFLSSNNMWNGKTFLHRSMSEESLSDPWSHGLRLTRRSNLLKIDYRHDYVGAGYDAQTGFVRRTNYISLKPDVEFFIFPESKRINRHSFGIAANQFYSPELELTDNLMRVYYSLRFKDNSRISINGNSQYVYLTDGFDPTGTDATQLEGDTEYTYRYSRVSYRSNNANKFYLNFGFYLGEYFNGQRRGVDGRFNFRFEPYATLTLNYAFNVFDMPYLVEKRSTVLLGPSIDLSISKELFVSTFIQYNSQSENTNINARLQWRFAPVSDIFLVYSNNYFSGNNPDDRFVLEERNRSLVLKATYWLNL